MLFQYASDLHLEFNQNSAFMDIYPLKPVAPYLILAGDITILNEENVPGMKFLAYVSNNWKQCFIIPGNHDFYTWDVAKSFDFELEIFPNVKYINHQKIHLEDVDLYFSTLWSHTRESIEELIRDFKVCTYDNDPFNYSDHNLLHDKALKWLDIELSQKKKYPRIVVSHFVPCKEADAFPRPFTPGGRVMTEYYTASLSEYIEKWDVDYWIYGHNHWNKDAQFHNTKFVSNMLGYVTREQHQKFKKDKVIDL